MIRTTIPRRDGWEAKAEADGFIFHHVDGELYWDESVCYQFTLAQIENDLEDPTQELADMCLALVDEVVQSNALMDMLAIPPKVQPMVRESWQRKEPTLYGRFDFAYDGNGPAKLYEYNADTPTALFEAAYFQWQWLEEARRTGIVPADADQFNSIQETLIAAFEGMLPLCPTGLLHATCVKDTAEDLATATYVRDCAEQAGFRTRHVYVEDIGVDGNGNFVDADDVPIHWLFKLYPWEFMVNEGYAPHLLTCDTMFLEPAWKMVLSNKGILPLLWERYPNHPNLLPAWFHSERTKAPYPDYAVKPLFSREGANIALYRNYEEAMRTGGSYGKEGAIGQLLCPPPHMDGYGPVVGSWVVNNTACGIGIREDATPITGNLSRFVPHIIVG